MQEQLEAKDEVKKEGLMALIKKMYELMAEDKGEESGEMAEEVVEGEMPHMLGKSSEEGSLMSKAMEEPKGMGDDLDMNEIKEFLTKRKKSMPSKSINIMAVTKAPAKSFAMPKMKKY